MRMSRRLGLYSGLSSAAGMYPYSVTFNASNGAIKWSYGTPAQWAGGPFAVTSTVYVGSNGSGNYHVTAVYFTTPTFKGVSDSFYFRYTSSYQYNVDGLPIAWQLASSDENLALYRNKNFSATPPNDPYAIAYGTTTIRYDHADNIIQGDAELEGGKSYVLYIWGTDATKGKLATIDAGGVTSVYINVRRKSLPILRLYDNGTTDYTFKTYSAKYNSSSTRAGNNTAVTMGSKYMTVVGNTYGYGMAYVDDIDLTHYNRLEVKGTMHVSDNCNLVVWSSVGEYISDNIVLSKPLNESFTYIDVSELTGKYLVGVTTIYTYAHKITDLLLL